MLSSGAWYLVGHGIWWGAVAVGHVSWGMVAGRAR